MRVSSVERKTRETAIKVRLNVDGSGKGEIKSKIGFLNHMLETFARHGLFDIEMEIEGDLHVGMHHTVEDAGMVLGEALKIALGEKRGLKRAGFFIYPMDETLAMAAIDISGRPYLKLDAKFKSRKVGDYPCELLEDFLRGFISSLLATLHIKIFWGRSDHHKIEAVFKALGRATREACETEERARNEIPSTKGML
jgi:imidazoleglycerol-phosphate dehydratase